MAHFDQMFFFHNVKTFFPSYFNESQVLEIGSLDINGTVRDLFTDSNYTGIDIGPGPKVDFVCSGEDFSEKAQTYDVVLSTEVFEHAADWDLIVLNMLRLMKKEGLLIFSCAGWGRGQHGTQLMTPHDAPHVATSSDHYKNLAEEDFRAAFNLDYWFADHVFITMSGCLYYLGLGRQAKQHAGNMASFKMVYKDYVYKRNVLGLPHEYIIAQTR